MLCTINISEIESSPYQPRKEIDQFELNDLARSIQELGLIQPIIVRKTRNGYQLLAGERRLRACKMIGYTEISAILVEAEDLQAAAVSLAENLQRKNLNYFEEAMAYAQLIGEFNLTQEEIAQKIGRSRSVVANRLRLLKLNPNVIQKIDPDLITERHARELLRLDREEDQLRVLERIYKHELTVKQTEELIDNIIGNVSRETETKDVKTDRGIDRIEADNTDVFKKYLDAIKKLVAQAQASGVGMFLYENNVGDKYEIVIKINPKHEKTQVEGGK